jgi:hypothetical protein
VFPRRSHIEPIVRLFIVSIALCAVSIATPAGACPNCVVGREARARVWSDAFAPRLAVAVLPFLLIGAICLRVEGLGRPPNRKAKSRHPYVGSDPSQQQSALHTGEP